MSRLVTRPAKLMCARRRLRSAWASPSLIRVFTVRMKNPWVISYPLSAQQILWLDWADAQADLSFHWAHTHFVGFVMRRLICWSIQKLPWETIVDLSDYVRVAETQTSKLQYITSSGWVWQPQSNNNIYWTTKIKHHFSNAFNVAFSLSFCILKTFIFGSGYWQPVVNSEIAIYNRL